MERSGGVVADGDNTLLEQQLRRRADEDIFVKVLPNTNAPRHSSSLAPFPAHNGTAHSLTVRGHPSASKPTVVVNGQQFRGTLDCTNANDLERCGVLAAICASFANGAAADICTAVSQNYQ